MKNFFSHCLVILEKAGITFEINRNDHLRAEDLPYQHT